MDIKRNLLGEYHDTDVNERNPLGEYYDIDMNKINKFRIFHKKERLICLKNMDE